MNISMYQASVPRFVNILGNLSGILDKAQAHVDAKKIDAAVLPNYRLFPDMLPMTTQVQIACDAAKGVVARLAGVEIPVFEDNEKTLADLKARVAKTIAFIKSVNQQRHAIPARPCAAEFLFSRHHHLQHPSSQRGRDRQARLLGQPLVVRHPVSFISRAQPC